METDFQPFEWRRLLFGEQPYLYYLEVAFKIVVIFCLLILVMRLLGKRGQQNLSPMQQMLLIALGSSAGDVLLYPSVAILYAGLILIGVTSLTIIMERSADNSRAVRGMVETCPRVLIRHGKVDEEALHHERTNVRELYAALRCAGARSLDQVEVAILEVSGNISVFLNDTHPPSNDLLDYLLDGPPDGRSPRGGPDNIRPDRE